MTCRLQRFPAELQIPLGWKGIKIYLRISIYSWQKDTALFFFLFLVSIKESGEEWWWRTRKQVKSLQTQHICSHSVIGISLQLCSEMCLGSAGCCLGTQDQHIQVSAYCVNSPAGQFLRGGDLRRGWRAAWLYLGTGKRAMPAPLLSSISLSGVFQGLLLER